MRKKHEKKCRRRDFQLLKLVIWGAWLKSGDHFLVLQSYMVNPLLKNYLEFITSWSFNLLKNLYFHQLNCVIEI